MTNVDQEQRFAVNVVLKESLKLWVYQMKKDKGKSNAKGDNNKQKKLGDNDRT